jgi:Ribonuclease G/E
MNLSRLSLQRMRVYAMLLQIENDSIGGKEAKMKTYMTLAALVHVSMPAV